MEKSFFYNWDEVINVEETARNGKWYYPADEVDEREQARKAEQDQDREFLRQETVAAVAKAERLKELMIGMIQVAGKQPGIEKALTFALDEAAGDLLAANGVLDTPEARKKVFEDWVNRTIERSTT